MKFGVVVSKANVYAKRSIRKQQKPFKGNSIKGNNTKTINYREGVDKYEKNNDEGNRHELWSLCKQN